MPDLFKRYVELGRVVILNFGKHKGKIAAIVSIGDHNRAIVHGPSVKVPRHEIRLRNVVLTSHVIPRDDLVAEKFDAAFAAAAEKWNNSPFTKSRAAGKVRGTLNDFDRFKRKNAHGQSRAKWVPKYRAARAEIIKSAHLEEDLRRRFA